MVQMIPNEHYMKLLNNKTQNIRKYVCYGLNTFWQNCCPKKKSTTWENKGKKKKKFNVVQKGNYFPI